MKNDVYYCILKNPNFFISYDSLLGFSILTHGREAHPLAVLKVTVLNNEMDGLNESPTEYLEGLFKGFLPTSIENPYLSSYFTGDDFQQDAKQWRCYCRKEKICFLLNNKHLRVEVLQFAQPFLDTVFQTSVRRPISKITNNSVFLHEELRYSLAEIVRRFILTVNFVEYEFFEAESETSAKLLFELKQ